MMEEATFYFLNCRPDVMIPMLFLRDTIVKDSRLDDLIPTLFF